MIRFVIEKERKEISLLEFKNDQLQFLPLKDNWVKILGEYYIVHSVTHEYDDDVNVKIFVGKYMEGYKM
jgi:hypothetical protein